MIGVGANVKKNPGKVRRWMYECEGSLFGPLFLTKESAKGVYVGDGVKVVRVEFARCAERRAKP